jgi:putative nucleotidyltransferase with HDIG domain
MSFSVTLSHLSVDERGERAFPADSPPRASDSTTAMLDALVRAMSARDGSTREHAERVQGYASAVAREARIVDDVVLSAIRAAALLHDVGKLAIPDRLLHKPGPLTPQEYEEVKQHATIGADILSSVAFPGPLALFVRHHHENWDGTGYPDGLQREAIPVGSRVLAIVDCYDALTSDRPYRRARAPARPSAMIFERRGTKYDPAITDAFLNVVWRLRSTAATERAAKQYAHPGSKPKPEVGAR